MPRRVILALDQGTTSSRAIAFDDELRPLATAQREFAQHYPRPGWVEHDPREIWESQLAVAREALAGAGLTAADVAAIGIANQRETALLWDRRSGEPVGNAIVWQDRRTAGFCDDLRRAGHDEAVQRVTGLVIDAYFAASKLRWMLDHIPGARDRASRGVLAFGTVDSWLLWQLTGGALHWTDATNASRTMLYDLRTGAWSEEMLALLDVPRGVLPTVGPSSGVMGETHPDLFGRAVPIAGFAGDQQAALFGQLCLEPGLAKNTYGTGCFMLMNVGEAPAVSRHRLVSTVAWQIGSRRTYALEGSVFIGGAVVQWLRDGLGLIRSAAEVEPLARSVPDSGGVYLVPAFAGLGAPHWDQHARGTLVGLTRGTTAGHLARAALEGIAFQVADVLDVMRCDADREIAELRVDGGAAANDLLLQFQADLLRVPIVRPRTTESTALGAAILAGLGVDIWRDPVALDRFRAVDRVFEPAMSADDAASRRARWRQALDRARDWDRGG